MTTADASPNRPAEDLRRRKLLDAAIGVFIRFGFRKTSMDEVARAADVSRQGLYLHFATKEELFRAAVQQVLESALQGACGCLTDAALPIEKRLIGAFDEWMGRFVGTMGSASAAGATGNGDLVEASDALVGPVVAQHEKLFAEALAKALRLAGLVAAYKAAGLTAKQLADTLLATGRGLKHGCASRAEFGERITHAVRALCMPLKELER